MPRPSLLLPLLCAALPAACIHAPRVDAGSKPLFAEPVAREPVLRVMTLNIAHATGVPPLGALVGTGTRAAFLDAIGTLIRRESPAVVAMQEVHRPSEGAEGLDHLERIRAVSGYPAGFFGTHLVAAAKGREQGTALLSRHPLESPVSAALNLAPGDDKGFVRATVRVPEFLNREVDVFSVHLDPYSEAKRQRQVVALADALRRRSRPAIVMGDFNARYVGPYQTLGRLLSLTDLRAHELTSGRATYPAGWPRVRIDWILITPELEFLRYQNVDAGVSDHQGVIAELRLVTPPMQMAGGTQAVTATTP